MTSRHMVSAISIVTTASICLMVGANAAKAEPITEGQAHAIGVDAYVYFYPLVTMDLTRKQLTNVEPGKGFGGPTNTFANVPAYPTAEDRAVVRPNFDTLYSSAWLDLTKEPMVVSVPDTARLNEARNAPFQAFSVEHINYFSPRSLQNLLATQGFDLRS